MFWSKSFVADRGILLAMCDEELIGKKIQSDDKSHEIEIRENFYKDKLIEDEETAVKLMKDCAICNLIGPRIVALAKKHGFITEENVISIGGIPHAQFVKL